jgi:hypothetical protein
MHTWLHHLYLVLLLFASVLALTSVLFASRMRETPGGLFLAILMSGVTVWCIGCILEINTVTTAGKLFACKIQYLGIATVPLTWFLFILAYMQRDDWLTRGRKLALWVIPAVTILLMWTNEWHRLMYR